MLLLTAETNSKVTSAFNFIPSKFWSFLQEVWKVVLHTGLNVHRETSGGSRFVTNSLLVCYKCSKRIPSSYTSMVFPVTFTKVRPIPIQNRKSLNTNFILEIYQKQPFDIIAMTPWETLGLCCVRIAQLKIHLAIYTLLFTLQLCYKPLGILQRVTKRQNVHISSHDKLQKLHNINFSGHRLRGFFREGLEKQEFPPSSVTFFKSNQKSFPWNLRVDIPS